MLKSKSYIIVLAYSEVTVLERYLSSIGSSFESITQGANFFVSSHGVSIHFGSEEEADKLWRLVMQSQEEEDE